MILYEQYKSFEDKIIKQYFFKGKPARQDGVDNIIFTIKEDTHFIEMVKE